MSKTLRFESLDSLRGLAALSVMVSHYTHVYNVMFGYDYTDYFSWKIGGRAVEMFFILSGFVIYFSVNQKTTVIEFVKKRFIRLYPTFWICLVFTLSAMYIFGLPRFELPFKEVILNFTMIPQVFGAQKIDYSYWTLVPEFFFYVMIALFLFTKQLKNLVYFGCFWMVLYSIHTYIYHIRFVGLFLNLDYAPFFFFGILVYELKQNKAQPLRWILLVISLLLGTLKYSFDPVEMAIVFGIFVLFVSFIFSDLKFLENRILLFLGKISFPLYLLHQNIGYIIINYTKEYIGNMWVIVPPIIFCVLLASFVTFYLEKPTIKYLKKKLL